MFSCDLNLTLHPRYLLFIGIKGLGTWNKFILFYCLTFIFIRNFGNKRVTPNNRLGSRWYVAIVITSRTLPICRIIFAIITVLAGRGDCDLHRFRVFSCEPERLYLNSVHFLAEYVHWIILITRVTALELQFDRNPAKNKAFF